MRIDERVTLILSRFASSVLIIVGVGLIVTGLWRESPAALASTLVVVGAGMLTLGVLLNVVEGPFKIGPGGVEAVLRKLDERVDEEGLPPEEADEVLGAAARSLLEGGHIYFTRGSGKTELALASLFEGARRTVDERITYQEAALETVQSAANELGAKVEREKVEGGVRFDALVQRENKTVAVVTRSRVDRRPSERSILGAVTLAMRRQTLTSILVMLDATPDEEIVGRLRAQFSRFPAVQNADVLPWTRGETNMRVKSILERHLA